MGDFDCCPHVLWRVDDDGYVAAVGGDDIFLEGPPIFLEAVLAHNDAVWREHHG